ncbi:MAG TPA: lysophospholipid acyltransferase family protein [Candidatus Binatia bacterium]|jgi:1-acyl-sn-glycerol-3-phosphate acyltransferase
MRWIKLTVVLSSWLVFFGVVTLAHLWISLLKLPNRWKIVSRPVRAFIFLLKTILNIKVSVQGDEGQLERGGYVIISNHVGYIDGIVLGALFPVIFVSKREVKSWPVIGQWTALCGTIFINRQRKSLLSLTINEIRRKLKQEANILLFPEGAATNGERMLPFQTAPLAAPLRNRSTIVPVTLAYTRIEQQPVSVANRDLIYCYGEMDFLPHFWQLLALRSVEVRVTIQPKIECFRYEDNSSGRKKLAADCYDRVLGRISGRDRARQDEAEAISKNSPELFSD